MIVPALDLATSHGLSQPANDAPATFFVNAEVAVYRHRGQTPAPQWLCGGSADASNKTSVRAE